MTLSIRTAMPADAEAIARVDLDAHIQAYRPLFGDDYLADATLETTAERWRRIMNNDLSLGQPPTEVLVVEQDGEVVAYSSFGVSRDEDGANEGEVYTLYVHPGAWRGGVGGPLLTAATDRLHEIGFANVSLWVLEANARARAFYEAQGWRHDGATKPAQGQPFIFLRYRAP
jgi:ribosomal protein S18 acetylase RimI-like enzyme